MLALALKLMLFLFGMLTVNEEASAVVTIAAFLTALILTSLGSYFSSRRFTTVSSALYFVISTFSPVFCPFLPLFCFDLLQVGQGRAAVFVLIPIITKAFKWGAADTAFLLLLIILSVFMQDMCDKIRRLTEENIAIRDSSAEQGRILAERNKNLMEKQDYEIHLATLKERNRIAREIHDNVGHILSRSILQIGAMRTQSGDEEMSVLLTGLGDTLSSAMDSVRGSVHDLRDEALDLYTALQKILEFSNCEIDLDYDATDAMPNNVKYCFLTIVKEALTNVARHSDATAVHVAVQEHPALYQLLIHDNGTKKPSGPSSGMGLPNMEDRVTALGGRFSVTHQNGFRIFISIPRTGEDNL